MNKWGYHKPVGDNLLGQVLDNYDGKTIALCRAKYGETLAAVPEMIETLQDVQSYLSLLPSSDLEALKVYQRIHKLFKRMENKKP